MPVYQNIPSWWTETQGGNCATTRTSTLADLPRDYKDTRPTALYLSPWLEGKWSLRDAVNVMVTASIATLRYGAKFREDVLYNRYQSGARRHQEVQHGGTVRLHHSAGPARSRSRRSSCCAASRFTEFASASSITTSRTTAPRIPRARGSFR